MIPVIETPRLTLRPMRDSDAPLLFESFQDPETSRYWFTPDKSLDAAHARVSRLAQEWTKHGFGDWAVALRDTGEFIGFAGLHYISGMEEVNLGYLLARPHWGRGYATEACLAAVSFGFGAARLNQIVGVTHPSNLASIRVLEKAGMTYWKDIVRNALPRVVYRAERSAR